MSAMPLAKLFISNSNVKSVLLNPNYSLNTNEVIIYTIYFPDFIHLKSDLSKFLSTSESSRGGRFHQKLDENRFIICRSILKIVLAAHTKMEAKNIEFDYHFNKKPYLASHPNLHFNVSHSENFAVIAISRNKVGIDIEHVSNDFNFNEILSGVFVENEISVIQNAVHKKHAFYNSWTRKEAFAKALGKGIDENFKAIPCLDGEHSIDSALYNTTADWHLYSFDFADQYLGAVAFENLSTISKNIMLFTIPNTMESLLEMIQIRKN